MAKFKFFRFFYPMYQTIHVFCPLPSYYQWILTIFIFIDYFFIEMYLIKPSFFFTETMKANPYRFILSFIYFLPWIFGTNSMVYDSIVWFVVNFLFNVYLITISYRCLKKLNVPFFFLFFSRLYLQFIQPLMSIPLFFRISLLIERTVEERSKCNIVSLSFYLMTFVIFVIGQFISSIFLMPYFFTVNTILDVYDGKSHLFLYVTQALFLISFMLLPAWENFPFIGFTFVFFLILLLAVLYQRMVSTVHVSLVAQYFELSPLFSMTFMTLYHLYGSFHFFVTFLIILLLHIIFIVILNVNQKAMKTISLHLFERFVYDEQSEVDLPKFVLGSITSSIRLIARYQSDPAVLCRFMENQKQTRLRTSAFIEICRFLVIFPQYRLKMLDEIKNFSTKSVYNDFLLFMFKYLLEQLNSTVMPEIYTKSFDNFYTGFIAHSYFYWKARKKKKVFSAFFEAFVCSYFVGETERMIKGLFYLYPFVTSLHKYLADILLNINGDYEGYVKEMRFCSILEKKKMLIFDSCFQANAKINPKILQFCDQDSQVLYSMSSYSSAMNTVNSVSTTFSIFQKKHKTEKAQKTKKSIASKIIKSERNLPYLHHLHFIFPPIIVIVFIFLSKKLSREYSLNSNYFNELISSIKHDFYFMVSSIFVKFASQKYLVNSNDCEKMFYLIPEIIKQYCMDSSILSNITDVLVAVTYREISNLLIKSTDVCGIVSNITLSMDQISKNNIDFIFRQNHYCNFYIKSDLLLISKLHNLNIFLLYGTIAILIFLLIYFITNCIYLNTIMSDNSKAIKFLSSKKRISPVLQDPETRENLWDQLISFDSSINLSESSPEFEFDNDIYTNSTSFLSNNFSSQGASSIKITKSIESALIPPVLLETAVMNEINQEQNLNLHQSAFTTSEASILDPSKNNENENDNNNNNYDSINLDPVLTDTNNNNNQSRRSSVATYPKEIDMNELMIFLKKKSKETIFLSVLSILMILLPWILLYFLALVGYYPLILRKNNEYEHAKKWFFTGKDFDNAIILLNETLFLIETKSANFSNYAFVNKSFSEHICVNRDLYFKERCDNENFCFSVFSVIQQIYNGNYTNEILEFFALPVIVDFASTIMNNFAEMVEEHSYINSVRSSFLALSFAFLFVSIIVGLKKSASLKSSLNSLFHFPSFENQNLNSVSDETSSKSPINSKESKDQFNSNQIDKNDSLNSEKNAARPSFASKSGDGLYRFPSNIILVTSVTETDEIYSISDTCAKIINRKPSDLICRKFSKIFPIKTVDCDFEIREYNGKTFISKTILIGNTSKTVLIEAIKSENKNKTTNVLQKLINFMPNYFAKKFSEEFVNFFKFSHCFLIFVRIDSKAPQIENFFTLINRLDQTFYNIDFIRSNGSILTFVCNVKDQLEIVLFLRDLIVSCEESCKKKMENFALKSVYVDLMEELNVDVIEGDIEPEVVFDENQFFEMEKITYFVDNHFVDFSDESIKILNTIAAYSSQKKNVNDKLIHSVSFRLFSSDEILKNM